MRAVLLGTPACAVPTFEAVLAAGHDVPVVVSQPDRPVGRSRTPKPPPIKEAALRHGLEVFQPKKVRRPEFLEAIEAASPDVLVVVAYGRILPAPVLEVAPHGAVNVHFSLLPLFRGAAPVQWALARGERVTGVTTMRLNEKMDEGDILLQEEVPILRGEHSPSLLDRLAVVGADLLVRTLQGLEAGSLSPRPQDHTRATYAPLLRREDGWFDPEMDARGIEGRVRGFDPWPGVWAVRSKKRVRIVAATALSEPSSGQAPGRVVRLEDDALLVACGGDTMLAVTAVQPEGRRAMSAKEAVNGRQLLPGDDLEPVPSTR